MKADLILAWAAVLFLIGTVATAFLPTSDIDMYITSKNAREYTPVQLKGKMIYQREGCWYCHTQQVRPVKADSALGPVSQPGDYVYDRPALLGTERTGPDLTWVGTRIPSKPWHIEHLKDPRRFSKYSIMPSFAYLPEDELDALAEYLLSRTYAAEKLAAGEAAPGRIIFARNCAVCHGASGEGTPIAPPHRGNKFIKESDLGVIKQTIREGRSGDAKRYKELPSDMPSFSKALAEGEIDAVAVYLKEELQK